MAMCFDGYIASKTKDLSWLNSAMVQGEDYGFKETMKRTGVYIMGTNTYKEMLKSGMAGGNDTVPTYVITSEKNLKKGTQIHLYEGNLKELVAKIKSETDRDICIWGGGNLVTQFIDLDLLDELNISIIPVLLGEGTPLFGKIGEWKKLKLAGCKQFKSGIVLLNYSFITSKH